MQQGSGHQMKEMKTVKETCGESWSWQRVKQEIS
jgi:hypothetical protein